MSTFTHTSLPPTIRLSDSAHAPLWLSPASVEPRPTKTFDVLHVEPLEMTLLEQIKMLGELPQGWDSYEGATPSRAVRDAASRFIARLNEIARELGTEIGDPKLLASGDGTLGFIWKHPDEESSLEIVIDERGVEFVSSQRGAVTEGAIESPEEALALLAR